MIIWGAIWGALISVLVSRHSGDWEWIVGALLGALAGVLAVRYLPVDA